MLAGAVLGWLSLARVTALLKSSALRKRATAGQCSGLVTCKSSQRLWLCFAMNVERSSDEV